MNHIILFFKLKFKLRSISTCKCDDLMVRVCTVFFELLNSLRSFNTIACWKAASLYEKLVFKRLFCYNFKFCTYSSCVS
jgi:hypothetical protein